MIPVVTRGISIEIMTDVLGTAIVKIKPAKKAFEVLPNVDRIKLFDKSLANVADKYFSLFFKDINNTIPPPINPIQAGIYWSKKCTHGVIKLKIEGIADIPCILEKNKLPVWAMYVKTLKTSSRGKKISSVQKLYQ